MRSAVTAGALRVVQVGERFDFAGVGVLGGVDLPQPLVQRGGLAVAAGLVVGGRGGEVCGEQGGAVGSEHALGEELVDGGEQVVFADGDGAGVAFGCGVAGVVGVVGAGVVGVGVVGSLCPVAGGGAGDAGHAAFAGAAPHVGAQHVGAAGLAVGVGLGAVAAGGVLGADGLGGVPQRRG